MNEKIAIEKIFSSNSNVFTVFVVEQRFAVGRGNEYFKKFINTQNFFNSKEKSKKFYNKILSIIDSKIAPVPNIISKFICGNSLSSITEIVTALCKLFTVTEHQAAGPDVIDPIIIQEGRISKKTLSKIININKESILRPTIIIILKDNDFDRAKELLSECPNGINVKMIRNSGEEISYKIINCGANDIVSFIDAYSSQCYSTCSNTRLDILTNAEWTDNLIISKFSPLLFKYRSSLLIDEKEDIKHLLDNTIDDIVRYNTTNKNDNLILKNVECVARLYRVFCNDNGGKDILTAKDLAVSIDSDILLAQVYECADLLPNCSQNEKMDLYEVAYKIFKENNMEDHAIYCKNNMLIEQFYSDRVITGEFDDLSVEAINNVPGMIGLTHIYNNVGVAYLYCGQAQEAIDFFNKGIDYAKTQHRIVQRLALESNKMIAESYSFCTIDENRIRLLIRQVFDSMGTLKLPFLTSDYVLNILSVAYRQNPSLGLELINSFPITELINRSFERNLLSASERILQMQYLTSKYGEKFPLLNKCNIPKVVNTARGKRKEYIERYGMSPFDFSTWM